MRKKLTLIVTLYYISIVISSCCNGRLFFEVSFKETEVSRLSGTYLPTFIISAIDPVEESGFLNGAIAKFQGFKSLYAMQPCPDDVYVFKKVITSIEITSNTNFDSLFTAGSILNSLFEIRQTKKDIDGSSENNYYLTSNYELGSIRLKTQPDSMNLHDLYFKYEFDNGEIHMDTLFNQNLSDSYFDY
ncbi:MAG: hypothetical protein CMP63_08370 [Flavobacteriales bacterium]|nr:hypothetical protein [Flavobacteriales bacterium]|tara:strand:- start:3555 stop:4118 length:564 start_codon:yes stop_codon:yes gene_type:complete